MSNVVYTVRINTDETVTREELMQISGAFSSACSKIENIGFVSAEMSLDGKSLSYDEIEEMS